MAIDYGLQPSNVVLVQVSGDVSDDDIRRILDVIPNDEVLPRPLKILVDARLASAIPADYLCSDAFSSDLLRSAESDGYASTLAYVVASDLLFGILRRSQMLLERHDMKTSVFREMTEACSWLGMSPEQAVDILDDATDLDGPPADRSKPGN